LRIDVGERKSGRTQREVENELSRMVLGGSLAPDDRLRVNMRDGKLTFEVEKGAAEETEEIDQELRHGATEVTSEHAVAPRA
jgi:hypothetical protein